MRNDAGFEIVADDTQRYAAEILKHMDIAVDPAQARLDIRKLAVRKRRDKEVYRIHLILVSGMKPHSLAAPIHLTDNAGLVRNVIREIILLNIFRVVVAELRVANRYAAFWIVFMLLPQQLERHTGLFQLAVDILIVDRCIHSLFTEFFRKEQGVDLIRGFVSYISKTYTELIGSSPNCCHRLR